MMLKSKLLPDRQVMTLVAAMLSLTSLLGCASAPEVQRPRENPEPIVLGLVDRAVLDLPEHAPFKASYDSTRVQQEFVGLLHQARGETHWLVFLGTWCGDSRREVPRFLKIADSAGIPMDLITLYGLDRSKKSPDGLEEEYRIEFVPTFVALAGGKEIGRIVEKPQVSMEADMLMILARVR